MSRLKIKDLQRELQEYKDAFDRAMKHAREAEAELAEAQREIDALKSDGASEVVPARRVADVLKVLIMRGAYEIRCGDYTVGDDGECRDLAALVHAWAEAEEICRAEAQEEEFRHMKDDLRESRARLDKAIDDILHKGAEEDAHEAGESADNP